MSAQIRSLTNGQGVDCVIIAAAAKSDAPCRIAVDICRDRGRIVDVGAVELNFPWYETYLKEIQIFMARAYGPGSYDPAYELQGQDYPLPYVRWTENRNMEEFLRLLSQGRIQIDPLITHRFPLEDAAKAYETIMDASTNSLAVLVKYPAADLASPLAEFQPKRRSRSEWACRRNLGNRRRCGGCGQSGALGSLAESQENSRSAAARHPFFQRSAGQELCPAIRCGLLCQ